MKLTEVAIGIVRRGHDVLICRRRQAGSFGGYWEFPGGKVEPGETAEQCLVRELSEEVGLEVAPARAYAVIEFAHAKGTIRLHPFLCDLISGEPRALASDEVRWVPADRLPGYSFPPANADLLAQLARELATAVPGDAPRHLS